MYVPVPTFKSKLINILIEVFENHVKTGVKHHKNLFPQSVRHEMGIGWAILAILCQK